MSKIEWTDDTWNPIVGCSKVSPGCDNCYAERMACRLQAMYECDPFGKYKHLKPYFDAVGFDLAALKYNHWSGKTAFVESALSKPLKRKKATMYFVCSMGDLFHESVPFEWIDKVFAVMALCPDHTFQVLTKRPERMAEYFQETIKGDMKEHIGWVANKMIEDDSEYPLNDWPLPNVWLGTTAENQEQADKRIPHLLQCPAAKRFVSVEPMLGQVELTKIIYNNKAHDCLATSSHRIDWVICGGESGPRARPMHPDWARSLRDQCKAASVPFFFKQWGAWKPWDNWTGDPAKWPAERVGKKKAGSRLDGAEHKEYPKGINHV